LKVDATITYIVMVKISIFWTAFLKLCGTFKLALVDCEWLISKLHFGVHNDLY
jgi:hypothetical protein